MLAHVRGIGLTEKSDFLHELAASTWLLLVRLAAAGLRQSANSAELRETRCHIGLAAPCGDPVIFIGSAHQRAYSIQSGTMAQLLESSNE